MRRPTRGDGPRRRSSYNNHLDRLASRRQCRTGPQAGGGSLSLRPAAASQFSAASDWFGQPRGLTVLFLTETWEKFSYYGMRAILVFYMTKALGFAQGRASLVCGLYVAAAYFTPLVGGPLADRWLGRRRAVVTGGLIMAAGHFMMAFPSLLLPALATIAVGNGLYLPSLPAQVGLLYAADDPRAKGAMNVYYAGVNFGGFLAPFVCGTLGEVFGWHYGFAAAGVGMLLGLAVYLFGGRWLPPPAPRPARSERGVAARGGSALETNAVRRLGLMFAIVAAVVVFRASYEQIGNTFALWTDTVADRRAGGFTIPSTWFQALNPLLVLTLTPLLVTHWARRAARGREGGTAGKMAFGALVVGAAFLILATATAFDAAHGRRTSWLWAVAFLAVYTAGELHILPVGLGLFARIAPAGLAATAVAVWFSAIFLGNLASGLLGQLWSVLPPAVFMALVGAVCLVPAVLLLAFDRPIRRAEASLALQESA